jgi:CRISPR/Cas system endoribonuclease Cas6 (RAMP superfamily)
VPTQWTLELASSVDLHSQWRYDTLHGIACGFFEQSGSDHDADSKPFAVRHHDRLLTLTWLAETPPPVTATPVAVRFRARPVPVDAVSTRRSTYAADMHTPIGSRRVRLTFVSPTLFRKRGSDYVLPDPYLTYSSLGRRYLAVHPDGCTDEDVRTLAQTAVIYDHDIRTEPFAWHGSRSAGFIGTVTFGLPHTYTEPVRRLFSTLNRFAQLAGVGHGTTHGLGAVDVSPF